MAFCNLRSEADDPRELTRNTPILEGMPGGHFDTLLRTAAEAKP